MKFAVATLAVVAIAASTVSAVEYTAADCGIAGHVNPTNIWTDGTGTTFKPNFSVCTDVGEACVAQVQTDAKAALLVAKCPIPAASAIKAYAYIDAAYGADLNKLETYLKDATAKPCGAKPDWSKYAAHATKAKVLSICKADANPPAALDKAATALVDPTVVGAMDKLTIASLALDGITEAQIKVLPTLASKSFPVSTDAEKKTKQDWIDAHACAHLMPKDNFAKLSADAQKAAKSQCAGMEGSASSIQVMAVLSVASMAFLFAINSLAL